MSIEHQTNAKKLKFFHYISTLEESTLAKEIFSIQKQLKFPGFVPEMRNLIKIYDLPDILDNPVNITKQRWASKVKEAE